MTIIGEIRKSIGKDTHKQMYIACPICGKERWVTIRNGKPISELCLVCCQIKRWESLEARQKQRETFHKYWDKPESREKQSISQKKRCENPEEIEKRRLRQIIRYQNPEERVKTGLQSKISWENPQTKEKHSDSMKKDWANPEQRTKHEVALRSAASRSEVREKHRISANRPEVKEKTRQAAIKQFANPENRIKASILAIERCKNPAIRKVMRDALDKYWSNPEAIEKDRLQAVERMAKPERKELQRRKMDEFYNNHPEARKLASDKSLEQWANPEFRDKWEKEVKPKHSKAMIEHWANPEYRNNTIKAVVKGRQSKPNIPETRILSVLSKYYPNEWMYAGDKEVAFDGLNPDFIDINGRKLIIEYFGSIWHDAKSMFDIWGHVMPYHRTVQGRIESFAKYGYRTLVLNEKDMKLSDDLLANKIHDFVGLKENV